MKRKFLVTFERAETRYTYATVEVEADCPSKAKRAAMADHRIKTLEFTEGSRRVDVVIRRTAKKVWK